MLCSLQIVLSKFKLITDFFIYKKGKLYTGNYLMLKFKNFLNGK